MAAYAHAEARQRIRRTARWHVIRRQDWPAEHGVHEGGRVAADHELLVNTLLANLHVHAFVQERLLIPEFPQARGVLRFDPARGIQRTEVELAQVAAVNLQCASVERPAFQTA